MKVIGLSAKMQGGKTTSTSAIIEHFKDSRFLSVTEISFARFLKEIVAKCFFGVPEFTENMKEAMVSGKTGREWLQIVGTDWFRKAHGTCWVNAAAAEIENILEHSIEEEIDVLLTESDIEEDLFVISDVRFPNELKFVQDIGGHVIRLLRNPQPDCAHESETALDEITRMTFWATTHSFGEGTLLFDTMFDNSNITVEEKNKKVIAGIIENGWV